MKGVEFPIIGTKVKGLNKKFNLSDPKERAAYFEAKAGPEIKKLKKYLQKGRFVANLVGKKNSGKGTRAKIFLEIFGSDAATLVGVGDIIREVHTNWQDFAKSPAFAELQKHYRGFISFDEAVERLHGRTQSGLLPTEFILALVKYEVAKSGGKSLFIDGLPRDLDQVSYSLFLRDLINYSTDPDLFVLIDIPESVIAERIKYRVICPVCHDPRNLKLLPTRDVGFDPETKEFYLKCDNPACKGARMVPKEGLK